MRGLYRDMVWLLNHPSIIPNELLGGKLESRFPDMEKTEWKVGLCYILSFFFIK